MVGERRLTADASGPTSWTVSQNVSGVQSGKDLPLVVTAYDSSDNPLDTFNGTLHPLSDPLTFDLSGAYSGGNPDPVGNLRFINSVQLEEIFTGTIGNLPNYYQGQLQVLLNITPWNVDFQNANGGVVFTSPSLDAGQFPVGLDPVTVLVGGLDLSRFGAESQNIDVIDSPSWLSDGSASFNTDDGAYHFDNATVGGGSLQLPAPTTSSDWINQKLQLDQLTTDVGLTATLNVVAPLDVGSDATFNGTTLTAEAIVLGKTFLPQTQYAPQNVTGKLDNLTLDPIGLSISLAPVQLPTQTLLNETFTIPVLTTTTPVITGTISLNATLTASGMFEGGIALMQSNGQIVLDPSGSFFTLTVTPTATVTVSAEADLFWGLVKLKASAFGSITVVAGGTARFQGSPLNPTVSASTNFGVNVSGDYDYSYTPPAESAKFLAHSPVGLLVTDPQGQRLGYDPNTDSVVNDFGCLASYSGPNTEPEVLDISMGSVVLGSNTRSAVSGPAPDVPH